MGQIHVFDTCTGMSAELLSEQMQKWICSGDRRGARMLLLCTGREEVSERLCCYRWVVTKTSTMRTVIDTGYATSFLFAMNSI